LSLLLQVSFYKTSCAIVGFMNTNLIPNADLSGFAFTTANDVETRTLPLLKKQIDSAVFRLCCNAATADGSRIAEAAGVLGNCDAVGKCCSDDDIQNGCQATTLNEQCDFR